MRIQRHFLFVLLVIVAVVAPLSVRADDIYVSSISGLWETGIVRFSAAGVPLVVPGAMPGHGFSFDAAGNIFLARSGSIHKITPGGATSVFVTEGGAGAPKALAFDSAGTLYATDYIGDRLMKITPAGVPSVFVSTGLDNPQDLVFDDEGNLFVANYNGHNIVKVTPGGWFRRSRIRV